MTAMTVRITVDVFSGRPNPTVVLTGGLAAQALHRSRPVAATGAPADWPPVLGYRGIAFEQLAQADPSRPRTFRLRRGVVSGPRGFVARPMDTGFEQELLAWFGTLSPEWAGLTRFAGEPAMTEAAGSPALSPELASSAERRRGCAGAPTPDTDWWSDGRRVQLNNNCYNYATNYRTDTFAQPGRASATPVRSLTCDDVVRGALADQLTRPVASENRCPPQGHLVALVVATGFDFHWYRKGRNGRWTHKVGVAAATANDNAAGPIADPRTADRGPYTEFCGFFVVIDGHVRIA
jgi:hypothetical protein